jgi:hypothetical protein
LLQVDGYLAELVDRGDYLRECLIAPLEHDQSVNARDITVEDSIGRLRCRRVRRCPVCRCRGGGHDALVVVVVAEAISDSGLRTLAMTCATTTCWPSE